MTRRGKEKRFKGASMAALVLFLIGLLFLAPVSGPAPAEKGERDREAPVHFDASDHLLEVEAVVATAPPQPARRRSLAVDGIKGQSEPEALLQWVAISGQVIDARGEAAAGVEVSLLVHPEDAAKARYQEFLKETGLKGRSLRAETSADGGYCFDRLPPCSYSILIEDPVDGELPRKALVDQDVRWDFTLLPRMSLSGKVLTSGASAVSIQALQLVQANGYRFEFFQPRGSATIDALGHYEIRGLQPGRYEVLFWSPGGATGRREITLVTSVEAFDVSLKKGLEFAGEISCSFPLEPGRISISLWGDDLAKQLTSEVTCSETPGVTRFRFQGLAPGNYELEVSAFRKGGTIQRVERRLPVELTQAVTDYAYTLSTGMAEVRIRVDGPPVDGFVDGRLQATGAHGAFDDAVRLLPGAEKGSHGIWRVDSFGLGLPTGSFETSDSFELRLPLGTWDLQLDLSGYRVWSKQVTAHGDVNLVAPLELRDGRAVNVELASKPYLVESSPASGGPWVVLSSRRDVSPVVSYTPDMAWLPVGQHDLRISTQEHKELIMERLVVTAGHEPLQVAPILEPGLSVSGQLLANVRSSTDVTLHLLLFEEGRWRLLPTKMCKASGHHPEPGKRFLFQGLHPGRYRVALDAAGRQWLDEWRLGAGDLTDVVLNHQFR